MNSEAHIPCTGERAGEVIFSQWQELCRLRLAVLDREDAEAVHDLRVATRRLRAMVGLFEPFIPAASAGSVTREVRRLTRKLGRLRNVDEAAVYFDAAPRPLPVLAGALRTLRVQEMETVAGLLAGLPRRELDRHLREAVAALAGLTPGDPTLQIHFSEISLRRFQAVHGLLPPATVPENVAERHALRIAIKKWRYLLETLGQVCRRDYSAALATLKGYQTLLGHLNDLAEFALLCEGLALPAGEREALAGLLAHDNARCLASFFETAASRPLQYTFLP